MGDHLGMALLDELDPRGAARGEHGHGLARLDAVDELARLLHDGEVGGDVHVEHMVGAEAADGCHHLALDVGADGHIERFAQRRADGGRREEHDLLGGVGERLPHVLDGGIFGEGADGAGDDALTAAHADGLGKGHIERRTDVDVEASADGADGVDVLLAAGGDAAHAVDALVVVSDDVRGGGVDGEHEVLALEAVFVDAVTQRELLKFAVVVALAGEALLLVLAQDELERHLAALAALFGVGAHLHAFGDGIDARGDEPSRARCLDEAHTAGAHAADVFEVAEGGDLDVRLARRFEDGRPLGHADGDIIDL